MGEFQFGEISDSHGEYEYGCLLGFYLIELIMEAIVTPKTSVNFYHTTKRNKIWHI